MKFEFIRLIKNQNGHYEPIDCSALEEWILYFLTSEIHCSNADYYIKLAYDQGFGSRCDNTTCLKKEGGYMLICLEVDVRDEEDEANAEWLKLTIEQYVKILENWRDQVCKPRPSEVIIRYEDGDFVFETKK